MCAVHLVYAPLEVRRDDGHQIRRTPDVYAHRNLDHTDLDSRASPQARLEILVKISTLAA